MSFKEFWRRISNLIFLFVLLSVKKGLESCNARVAGEIVM